MDYAHGATLGDLLCFLLEKDSTLVWVSNCWLLSDAYQRLDSTDSVARSVHCLDLTFNPL